MINQTKKTLNHNKTNTINKITIKTSKLITYNQYSASRFTYKKPINNMLHKATH